MKPEELISGAENVIETIGFWPSFHDAEVISFLVSRAMPDQGSATIAKLCVHYREHDAVGVGTADFEYVCQKSLLVELIFSDIHDLSLTDFNHQNVLESIDLKRLQDLSILVEIVSIWGIGGSIRCNHVAVGAVTNLMS